MAQSRNQALQRTIIDSSETLDIDLSTTAISSEWQTMKEQVKSGMENLPTSLFHRLRWGLGFRNSYDFVLWIFCSSFMTFFTFIRAPYLNPPTFQDRSSPGEWYWLQQEPYKFGIFLHLYSVLPAGFLAIFQFVPAIRTRSVAFHKYIGYIIMVLVFLGDIGVIIIMRRSMGGDLSVQAAIIYLTIATIGTMFLAWYNIKRQQIDQHRKWMLRAMFTMSIIVTMRVIQLFTILTISHVGGYFTLWTCDEVMFVTGNTKEYLAEFPACHLGMETLVGVPADIKSRLHIGSAVRLTFGCATWAAIALHAVGVEIYLHLTPKESERLRILSYYRQRAKGMPHAGSAGITSDRWGDGLAWMPPRKVID